MEDTLELQTSVETDSLLELERVADNIYDQGLKNHEDFEAQKWKKDDPERKSFHNEKHPPALLRASDLLIDAASQEHDPLGLQAELDAWNKENGTDFSMQEFKLIAQMAIGYHDNGNIMSEDGKYLEGYTSAGAEERSKLLLEEKMRETMGDNPKLEQYIALAKQLIDGTKAGFSKDDPENTEPFVRFMRIVDQVGNDYFSQNDDRLEGLATEFEYANPDAAILSVDGMVNFPVYRLNELTEGMSPGTKEAILAIWDRPEKQLEEGLSKDQIANSQLKSEMQTRSISHAQKAA